jgi:anti-sigma factor ChrR (cupin superfamily)
MSPASGIDERDHADLVSAYALGALPASEAAAMGAHISGCGACQHELATLRPVVESFAAWPTDVLRPSPSLWERLVQRIAPETRTPTAPDHRRRDEEWVDAAPGISFRLLATDTAASRVSMLVRLTPGADYPPHRHAGVEELHLLDGELLVDQRKLYPGDYLRSESGSVDHRVWSETGCTCVLVTSFHDVIL